MAAFTKSQVFQTTMLKHMQELNNGILWKYLETQTISGGETVTFNRLKESTTGTGVPSMFGDAYTASTGGDMEKFTATIDDISSQQKITRKQMKQTTVSLNNPYITSLGNSVQGKIDKLIIDAALAAAGIQTIGVNTAVIADQAKLVIGEINGAMALAKRTPDNHQGVALIIHPKDWKSLSTSDYVLNRDYTDRMKGETTGTNFFGAEVLITKNIAAGTSLILPSNVICGGQWENAVDATVEYHKTDGMTWHLQAVKSAGVVVAEAESIIKVISKP